MSNVREFHSPPEVGPYTSRRLVSGTELPHFSRCFTRVPAGPAERVSTFLCGKRLANFSFGCASATSACHRAYCIVRTDSARFSEGRHARPLLCWLSPRLGALLPLLCHILARQGRVLQYRGTGWFKHFAPNLLSIRCQHRCLETAPETGRTCFISPSEAVDGWFVSCFSHIYTYI